MNPQTSEFQVLFCTPTYAPFVGGTRAFVEAMSRRLVVDGHRPVVLTTAARRASDFWQPPPAAMTPLPDCETLDGVQVERLRLSYPWPAPFRFGLLRRAGLWLHLSGMAGWLAGPCQRWLARWMPPLRGFSDALQRWGTQVDLIVAVDASWDGLLLGAAKAAKRHMKPLIVCPLMHLGDAQVRAHFQMEHQVAVYRDAAAILALSPREAEALADLGVPRGRIHVIGMGVDSEPPISLQAAATLSFRREHGLGKDLVAFVGANTYDKGAFALTRAVIQLNLSGLPTDLVCVGPQDETLQVFLQRLSPEENTLARGHVHVWGTVDEECKHRLLGACDVFALPSQVDTFGIVFLEAWLHGKPVIGANAGGIPDLVHHEENGLLVPFGEVDALAAAIRRLLVEPGLATRLGAAGRQMVLQRYTWRQTYQTLIEVCSEVITEHRKASLADGHAPAA